jgi:chloramphenicol-sensitive protein RarD
MKKKYLIGASYTVFASLWWGIIGVIYFKFVSFASPVELTAHRTIWTAFLLIITTSLYAKWSEFFRIIKNKKSILMLFISGTLVMINWFTWIYAVSINKLLDSSFGYYIFPLFSVFFGIIFLKEKYNRNKIISIVLVFIAILYLIYHYKTLPWIGLTVAITFSLYTLIRKKINIPSDIGLLIETLLLAPFALIAFVILHKKGINIFSINEPLLSFYLFWAGLMTLVPLFFYTKGFGLLGIGPSSMIFFLTPTAQFFLGITYFKEALDVHKLGSFVLIWIAVAIYLNELRREQ